LRIAEDTHRADMRRTRMRLRNESLAVVTPAAIAETVEPDARDRARLP
jgi:hypothetical protein